MIDGAHRQATSRPLLEKAGTSSHGRVFYGWYVRAIQSKRSIWFGFLPRAWSQLGITPLWAQISESPTWSHQRLAVALASFGHSGGSGLFDDGRAFLIPLGIPHFVGREEVVLRVVEQLEQIAVRLDAALAPGESVEPDEPKVGLVDAGDDVAVAA